MSEAEAARRMIAFVARIGARARALDGDFLVILVVFPGQGE